MNSAQRARQEHHRLHVSDVEVDMEEAGDLEGAGEGMGGDSRFRRGAEDCATLWGQILVVEHGQHGVELIQHGLRFEVPNPAVYRCVVELVDHAVVKRLSARELRRLRKSFAA